jgi:hypothetical protein
MAYDKSKTPKGCLIMVVVLGITFLVILIIVLSSDPKEELFSETRIVNVKEAQVFTGAGNEFELDSLSPFYEGKRIYVLEEVGSWLKVSPVKEDTSKTGFIQKNLTVGKSKWELDRFMAEISKMQNELNLSLIESVSISGNKATIEVTNNWHIRNKQIRLQDAQALWEIWANINDAENVDSSRIELVDNNGNKVGGSKSIAGSLIEVVD